MNRDFFRHLRTLVILGRVSNLPTVWSNCLAGWWLGHGGNYDKLPWLIFGVSALYLGGMYLNDAFDAEYDRQHRPERPIPSGVISLPMVLGWGLAWLVLGAASLIIIGKTTGVLALILLFCIVLYDVMHKAITASPWLMGLCRFWIYVIAGSTGSWGINGWPIWCGAALAVYVTGLSLVAQRENSRGPIPYSPLALLAGPVLLALVMNTGDYRIQAIGFSFILVLWVARCARTIFQGSRVNVGRIVSGLLAGIVLVDLLAIAPDCPLPLKAVFLILFGATLGLQRFVPAT
ncbi:MAG TPA: UbiA family prenyltransferase [Candidatus Acidoferrales bacterium]|nr:UbiA family prenyltransferase [Candidatus Acidoferrales bacterium]